MCAYSMVVDGWRNPGPNRIPGFDPFKPLPDVITPSTAQIMLEVLRRLDELDKRLGTVDCKLDELEKQRFGAKLRRRAGVRKLNPQERI